MYQQEGIVIPMAKARTRAVGDAMPTIVLIVLAIFQMILVFAITGLEAASVYYDAGRGTIYAGFWCSIIFSVTWIAMLCYVCCKTSSTYGSYIILQNILSAIFAIILIVFTAVFINNPCLCYGILCNVPDWDFISTSNYYKCTPRTIEKLPVLKGLLSCAVLMFVSNLIFIAVYLIIYIRLGNKRATPSQIQYPETNSYQPALVDQPSNQYELPYLAPTISEPHYYAPAIETVPNTGIPNASVMMRSMKF